MGEAKRREERERAGVGGGKTHRTGLTYQQEHEAERIVCLDCGSVVKNRHGEQVPGGISGPCSGLADEPTVDSAEFDIEGQEVVVVDRDEFENLPEYSVTLPDGAKPGLRFKANIGGQWHLGRYVRRGEATVLLPPAPILLTSPAEVAAHIRAFRDQFVDALPEASREELGKFLDRALALVRSSAYAVAQGREVLRRVLEGEFEEHGRTVAELALAERMLAEAGLTAQYYERAADVWKETGLDENKIPLRIRRILAAALADDVDDPGALVRKVRELAGLEKREG